jgi:hypothetical protein
MTAPTTIFGSPSGEPNGTTNRPTIQQMCEKVWTQPLWMPQSALDPSANKVKRGRLIRRTEMLNIDACSLDSHHYEAACLAGLPKTVITPGLGIQSFAQGPSSRVFRISAS